MGPTQVQGVEWGGGTPAHRGIAREREGKVDLSGQARRGQCTRGGERAQENAGRNVHTACRRDRGTEESWGDARGQPAPAMLSALPVSGVPEFSLSMPEAPRQGPRFPGRPAVARGGCGNAPGHQLRSEGPGRAGPGECRTLPSLVSFPASSVAPHRGARGRMQGEAKVIRLLAERNVLNERGGRMVMGPPPAGRAAPAPNWALSQDTGRSPPGAGAAANAEASVQVRTFALKAQRPNTGHEILHSKMHCHHTFLEPPITKMTGTCLGPTSGTGPH